MHGQTQILIERLKTHRGYERHHCLLPLILVISGGSMCLQFSWNRKTFHWPRHALSPCISIPANLRTK